MKQYPRPDLTYGQPNEAAFRRQIGEDIDRLERLATGDGNVVYQVLVTDPQGSALTTGDGKAYVRIDEEINGYNLTDAQGSLYVASSSGVPTIQCRRIRSASSADMLSTKLTIDANEVDSTTAATPRVIDTTKDDVLTADQIAIDIDVAGTNAKGLNVKLTFSPP